MLCSFPLLEGYWDKHDSTLYNFTVTLKFNSNDKLFDSKVILNNKKKTG